MTATPAQGPGSVAGHGADQPEHGPRTTIYVISVPGAQGRRSTFERAAALERHGRSWTYFAGLTSISPALRYDPQAAIVARGRQLHAREVACYSSHYEAWRSFLATDDDQLLVIEDDVRLDWVFVENLLTRSLAAGGIDYLRLYSKNMTPYAVVSNDFHGRWLLDLRGFAYGTQAYMLTRKGASVFMDHCGGSVRRPIDDEMDRSWAHGLPNLTAFPFPAFEASGPSTIGADRDQFASLSPHILMRRRGSQVRERLLRLRQTITGSGRVRNLPAYPSREFGQNFSPGAHR